MFDKYLIKNKAKKSNIFKHLNLKIKGYEMKLSTIALAATVTLTFSGCVIDDVLNTTGSAINSITGSVDNTIASTKTYKDPILTITSPSQLDAFCHERHKVNGYVVKSLPPMKYVTTENGGDMGILQVIGTKSEVYLQPKIVGDILSDPIGQAVDYFDRANPDKIIKLKKPIYIYSDTRPSSIHSYSHAGFSGCEIEFTLAR